MFTRLHTCSTWLAAVAMSGLLVACGSTSSGSSAPTPAASGSTIVAQPSSTAGTPTPAATPPSAPSAATPGVVACRSASLAITVDSSQAAGAAGSTDYPLDFTNISHGPCEMYGYPGVSFVTAAGGVGQQIGAAAVRNRAFADVTVLLRPGGTAHACLQVAVAYNYPVSSCRPVTSSWLRIYPPGETVAGYLGHTFAACSSLSTPVLTILPVRAGQGLAGVTP